MTEQLKVLADAHKHSTQGKWQKGRTTHHTVTETGYLIGEFHHADDAAFCDLAHELVPKLIEQREADEALMREALDALNSGKHELRWAAADNLRARLGGV
jgi:hypothetical protein